MRRRRALILALAIGVAWLQPTGMPVPQYS